MLYKEICAEQKQISLLEEQLIWWGSLSDRNSDPRFIRRKKTKTKNEKKTCLIKFYKVKVRV
jgi:hypothetical protein